MSVPRRPWQPREAVAGRSRLLAISKGAGIATLVLLVVTGASVAGIVSSNQHHGVTPAAAAALPSSSSSATVGPGTSTVSAGTTSAAASSATESVSSSAAVVLAIAKPKSQGQPGIVPVPLAPHATAGPIPLLAWEAYHRAAAGSGCNLPWYVLAGIGKIESNHGRYGGAQFDVTGTVHPAIFGPPTAYGRAMGPMQFIPPTWASYAADGNGDDITNPQNIFDATKAAAHYLCKAGGPDLSGLAAQRRAVFAYNHLDSYVADVLAFAAAYQHSEPERVVHLVPIVYPKPATKAVATTPRPVSPATSASAGRTSAAPTSRVKPLSSASTSAASTTSPSPTSASTSGSSTPSAPPTSAPPTTSTCPTTPTPSTSATKSSVPAMTSGSTSAVPTRTTAAPSGSTSSPSTAPMTCSPCSTATATPSTSASAPPTACPTTAPSTTAPPTTPHLTQR